MLSVVLSLALWVAAVLYLQPTMTAPLNIYDEGIIVYGATRVMYGELPYRDFWTQYSPGQLYVLAGLFRLFGPQIAVERWWDVAVRAALSLVMFMLAGVLSSQRAGLVAWLIGVLWVTYYGFFGYPIFAGLLFSLFSIYALVRSFEQRRPWLIIAGLSLGVAALFRHDMAIYCVAAQLLVYAPVAFWRCAPCYAGIGPRLGCAARATAPFAVSTLLVVGPAAAFFALQVPAMELLHQLFLFPLTEFPKVRDLPYPKLAWTVDNLQFYAPFVVYPLAVAVALARARAGRAPGWQAWGVVIVALFGMFGFNQARVRSDTIHTVHFFLCAVVLLPVLLRGCADAGRVPRRAPLGAASSVVASSIGAVFAIAALVNPIAGYADTLAARPAVERALKTTLPIGRPGQMSAQQTIAVATMHSLTEAGDRVYIGLSRHDRVFANDAMFYFLLQRPSATRYHELHPGVTNTAAVQTEMVRDLERHRVRYVVLTDMFEGAQEPNDSARSTGVTLLDEYIATHYRTVNVVGPYRILARRP